MVQRIHQKLGTAGFVISILALVVALSGGAYAAKGGLTGKEKKEVKAIAKHFSGKRGPRGKNGQNGQNGTNGAPGAKGDTGAKGDAGAAGSNGQNGAPGAPGAPGAEGLEGPEGPEGSPWVAGGTLPAGKTETGAWAIGQLPAEVAGYFMPISFSIPLPARTTVNFVAAGGTPPAACPGTFEEPKAAPGNLCVYETAGFGMTYEYEETPETGSEEGAGKVGVVLVFSGQEFGSARGSWAVTAPTS